jgi:hypothetical protein
MPQKTVKGIPIYVWAGAGLLAVVVGYFFLRSNSSNASTTATQGAAGNATVDQNATDTYAAYLNQNSWLNSYLAQISQQLAGIASTQGASAPPNPSPPPPPNPSPSCCKPGMGILCRIGIPYCPIPPSIPHDGSGIISPQQLQRVA